MTRLQPFLRALSLALLASSTIVPGATAQQQGPYCAPCQNSNFVAYNRCSYWSIDDLTLDCGAIPCQSRFRLDSSTKKASIRFTISPALTGNQTIRSVWLYYRTVGTWTGPAYVLNVCSDANGVPGAVLNSSPFQPRVPGASGWQQVDLTSPVGGLVPGSVCHLVIAPTGTPSPTEYIELVVTRAGYPSRYVPTDGNGTSYDSPCDRFLSIMLSDSASGQTPGSDFFLVEAESNRGITPIFAVDLGPEGLSGVPFDEHVERTIAGPNQYGQMIQIPADTTVNYVAFWLRGMGCLSDCTGTSCPLADLEFRLISAANPSAPPTALIPHTKPYRGRSHWFGAFFQPQYLTAGTYYLVLSSPQSTGIGTDGWTFSMENSTLPLNFAQLPTYRRGKSYAIESTDGGASFHPLSRKGDTGFVLGNFPDGPQEVAKLCDHAVTVTCGATTKYAKTAQPGQVLTFSASNLNTGDSMGGLQYMRLLDENCNPLSQVRFCLETGPVGPNLHAISRDIHWTMGQSDAFVWLEFGHQDPHNPGLLISDERFPMEIRKGCSPCDCP